MSVNEITNVQLPKLGNSDVEALLKTLSIIQKIADQARHFENGAEVAKEAGAELLQALFKAVVSCSHSNPLLRAKIAPIIKEMMVPLDEVKDINIVHNRSIDVLIGLIMGTPNSDNHFRDLYHSLDNADVILSLNDNLNEPKSGDGLLIILWGNDGGHTKKKVNTAGRKSLYLLEIENDNIWLGRNSRDIKKRVVKESIVRGKFAEGSLHGTSWTYCVANSLEEALEQGPI